MKRGFSLIEILIAIFVLGIGLIMIAGVFPVAVKWTNQDAESTTAKIVAQNAIALLQIKSPKTLIEQYAPSGGLIGPYPYVGSPMVQGKYIGGVFYPGPDYSWAPKAVSKPCSPYYYWTAYVSAPSEGAQDVYIFVFSPPPTGSQFNTYKTSAAYLPSEPNDQGAYGVSYYPQLATETLEQAVGGTGAVDMPIDAFGIDTTTGLVFRRSVDASTGAFTIAGGSEAYTPKTYNNPVIFSPAPIGGNVSPCVYVYATTLPE